MAKPKTTYSPVVKQKTTYAKVAKPGTSYNRNSSVSSVLLNSATVTLNSLTVLLSGYTGATPNQLGNKPLTTYAAQ